MKHFLYGLLFFSSLTYADNIYYCALTSQSVSLGDTLAKVFSACGQPTKTSTTKTLLPTSDVPVEWVYTTGPSTVTPQGIVPSPNASSIIFTIQDGVVTQVQRTGTPISGNIACNMESTLGMKSTAYAVRLTCGNPTYIQPVAQNNSTEQVIVTWTYDRGPYQPQMIFTFTDGVLTNIKSGQLGNN